MIHSRETFIWYIQERHSYDTFKRDIHMMHSRETFIWYIQERHSYDTFKRDIQERHSCDTFKRDIHMIHSRETLKRLSFPIRLKSVLHYHRKVAIGETVWKRTTHNSSLYFLVLLDWPYNFNFNKSLVQSVPNSILVIFG